MKEIANNKLINNGLVTVIVPVYNGEKYLNRCLESIIGQTYKKIEIILVDDGSTDNGRKICDEYALADNRIKVISQENKGPAAARNTGIRYATGDFVFFLDADDFIENNTIEILVAKYKQYQPDLVMANFSKLENNKEIVRQGVSFHPDNEPFEHKIKELSKKEIINYVRHFLKHPSNHLISYCWARLYKLSIIKNNNILANENMRLFEDFVFNLDYLKHTNKIVFINEPLYIYVMYNSHVSASMTIINTDSLTHDMKVFKEKASEFLQQTNADIMSKFNIKKEIGHALFHYAIIFLIRSCRQIAKNTRKKIYDEIKKFINTPIFRESLKYYSPSKGNSRILPMLARLRLVNLIILYCRHKAHKRYGKLKKSKNIC